jgi:tRNA uridine 5-carboxymethylaminomethyl modification enzyme
MQTHYDIIVVGGGHAGCEAAAAAANMGSKVLLITMNLQTIAQMSCNPAMGGVAKGQIVREIDALGGYSGIVTDKTMIQFRMLNKSKGAAMWSPRAQSDRWLFAQEWRIMLEKTPNVDFFQDTVSELVVKDKRVTGVKSAMGMTFNAKAVVLTNGTFLNGLIHIGRKQFGGGRMGERAVGGITEQLETFGFESGRMKTGTPPRVDGRSINYDALEEQKGDENPTKFSYSPTTSPLLKQRSCYITYTNPIVHDTLRDGLDDSPMYNGTIQSIGPRYCPSIEDKINRFAERDRHQIFVEPEGWDTVEVYVNGFSTSLPDHIQVKALQQIEGFEKAKIFRPGYAIEYDYFPPTQLHHTLETKLISNLYFAGQINGTTGYEEAACQGMMAAINAHNKINEKDPFILSRSDAYIGVLIDDLINKGTDEPYRMFTSRAEYRILLRQDNADIRLTKKGHELGIASNERLAAVNKKIDATQKIISHFKKQSIHPSEINSLLSELATAEMNQANKLNNILLRPQVSITDLEKVDSLKEFLGSFTEEEKQQAEIGIKYETYIEKETESVEKMNRLEDISIPLTYNFKALSSLSSEAKEKLTKVQPQTIGQASRISGVSPADISVLMVQFGR